MHKFWILGRRVVEWLVIFALGHGIIMYLATIEIFPDRFVASMITTAVAAPAWAHWVMAGLFGILGTFLLERFLWNRHTWLTHLPAVSQKGMVPDAAMVQKKNSLSYLSSRDSDLGDAIIRMARQSAWGRWYAAQQLVKTGVRLDPQHLYQIAAGFVMEEIINGNLEVRGRRPDSRQLEYTSIDRTHWRSSCIHYVSDPTSLWKMKIIPTGGVELNQNGSVIRIDNHTAAQRTSLLNYDSFIVDAYQFEKLWPKREKDADKKRRQFLWQAWWRGLDRDEIRRLWG